MAAEAPRHVQILGLPRQRHLIDTPVTRLASHTFIDVNAVIEVNEVWKAVDAVPAKWTVIAQTRAHRFKHVACGPHLFVTVHAGRRRRNPSERAALDLGVAIPAVDAESCHVMRVTERYRLVERDSFVCNIR